MAKNQEEVKDNNNEAGKAPVFSTEKEFLQQPEGVLGIGEKITVELNDILVEKKESQKESELEEERKRLKEIYKRLIDHKNLDNTKDTKIIEEAIERLKDPETVEMLEGWKEHLGVKEIVVYGKNGKAIFTTVDKNPDVQKQVARYKALTEGEEGEQRKNDYINYELKKAKSEETPPLTDEEEPKFMKFIKELLSDPETEIFGPSAKARFLVWAHGGRLMPYQVSEYDRSFLEIFRSKSRFAPRGDRFYGSAGRRWCPPVQCRPSA